MCQFYTIFLDFWGSWLEQFEKMVILLGWGHCVLTHLYLVRMAGTFALKETGAIVTQLNCR
jgi:hypothetical protein